METEVPQHENDPVSQDVTHTSVFPADELLQPLTAALLEAITPSDVVATCVDRGVAVLGAEAGLVVLLREDPESGEGYLNIVGARGYSDAVMGAWSRFPLAARLPLSDAVREQTPLFFTGRADMEARYPEMFHQGPLHPVKASVSLPLIVRGRAFGALHFSFVAERGVFTDSDRTFLLELTRQCSLALDRALLLERLEQERASADAARARQEFLARASALLGESLDYQTRLEALVRLCVPELADWVGVDVLAEDGSLVRLAVAHRIPEREDVIREIQRRYPPDPQRGPNSLTVIQTGERLFFPDIPEALIEQGAIDAEHASLLKRVGVCAALIVPLTARGRTLGALTLGMGPEPAGSGRRFTEATVTLVEEVAHRAAVAVDNARLVRDLQDEVMERRRAEAARNESEANYRLVTDTIPQIIWGANRDGWVDFVHPRIERYTGVPAPEVTHTGWLSIVHPDDRESATQRWVQSLTTGEFYETEFRLIRAEGGYSWNMASALPRRDPDGTIVRWFGTLTDIEERRRLQDQVEAERTAALQNQRRFLREMLFGMTEGHLRLCDSPEELPSEFPPAYDPVALSPTTLRVVRKQVGAVASELHFARERVQDILTAVSEAAMNAVTHGSRGIARVHDDPTKGIIQVWIRDTGEGIAEHLIHRAVESGWTTGGFGQGFHLMWKTSDCLYLLTGSSGTTVVLEMNRNLPTPIWLKS